jgi:hypothetical protein
MVWVRGMEAASRRAVPNAAGGVVLIWLAATAHAGGLTLTAAPHQQRARASDAGIVPLWDTSWWITLRATRGDAPLARIEYTARFSDSSDPRSLAGAIEVSDADRDDVSGRIEVTCPTRPDYEKKLRVKLRVTDARGAASNWSEFTFPVRSDEPTPAPTLPMTTQPRSDRRSETLGSVEVDATDRTTIGEAKTALQRKARAKGGDAAVGLRLIGTTDDHVTFAADVIRYADVPQPAPTPAAILPANPERVLGEIAMPAARR